MNRRELVEYYTDKVKDLVSTKEITLSVIDDIIPATWDDPEEIYDHEEKFSLSELYSLAPQIESLVDGLIDEEVDWFLGDDSSISKEDQEDIADTVAGRVEGSYYDTICEYLNSEEYKYR